MNTTAAERTECGISGCARKVSRTGWMVFIRDQGGMTIDAVKVCGRHAAIDRGEREERERSDR